MKLNPIDFETKKIDKRPVYPPVPVGVALEIDGKSEYLAWGHPTNNNCKRAEAKKILRQAFKNDQCVFHNAAFDLEVARVHLGLKYPKFWDDTLFLAYLHDPREKELKLKSLADKYLNMPPTEQEKLNAWILKYVFEANGIKPTKKNPLGAYISEAPGDLVGRYAKGDIIRTKKLYRLFYKDIKERGMLPAYAREKFCMPIFEGMSKQGVCINHKRLAKDTKRWIKENIKREYLIKKELKAPPDLLLSSGPQLAKALDAAGFISHWIYTAPSKRFPKGQKSTSRENIMKVCTNEKLAGMLALYGKMNTFINTFALPWLVTSESCDGRVYPSFNQVRSTDDFGKSRGTRTGRPSSNNPNFLNVPKNQKDAELPNMREYVTPDPGMSLILRDYSQQELRILAHFEEGDLYRAYLENPLMDAHDLVHGLIEDATGIDYGRHKVKVVNFGVVYGMGVGGLARATNSSEEEARELKTAHGIALPGVKELSKEITRHCKKDLPIRTWGGREYFVEEAAIVRGQRRDFYYKLLNYLIQGSAADCTKEAMIRADIALRKIGGRLVIQVYDEILACVPKGMEKEGHRLLKEAMESVEFSIPMLSDGKTGKKSWGGAKPHKDKK